MILRDDATLPITQRDIDRVVERFQVTLPQWVQVLSCYTIEARLRLAVRFLLVDRQLAELKVSHEDLCELVCATRERVTRAVTSLRRKRVLAGTPRSRCGLVRGSVAP